MSKQILGLDLGTNSIGWAVVRQEEAHGNIAAAGSRIIPMGEDILGKFNAGNSISQTAERTKARGVRRLRERYLLRRERLHRVLNRMGFLPEHYALHLDRYGKIDTEVPLAWKPNAEGKNEFLFMDSFREMLADFRANQPDLLADDRKIPLDWTIYYLRKKALTQPLTKEELAWLLLHFNQKRGYYQLRGEEEEDTKKLVEFHALKVIDVQDTGEKKGNDTWYNVVLENGWIYRRASKVPLDWVGQTKEFIVTTDLDDKGQPKVDKEGTIKRSFRVPQENDWTLRKKKTEHDIELSHKTVGEYIYDTLLQIPTQKVRGKLVHTIERKYYKKELIAILEKQTEFIPELRDRELYKECVELLYPTNEAHRNIRVKQNFVHLFVDDILFYQRPLKTKKSLISDCPYEVNYYVDKDTKELKKSPIKCIAKSNPLYQEFRLWQFVSNLRIYERETVVNGKLQLDYDVTNRFLPTEDAYADLFDWLYNRKDINQKTFLRYEKFGLKKEADKYRWNYVEDKDYPCNETRATILARLKKADISADFLTADVEENLWHILYSIDDKQELQRAIHSFADKHNLGEKFVEVFAKCPPFQKEYGAYSAKAIKKLLALMRMGRYWSADKIDANTRDRIDKIITAEYDENIRNRVREKALHLSQLSDFKGLPLWLACYVVYDRHAEAKDVNKWETPDSIDEYLKTFKQHSLRNPIVEQVVTETLRTVRDIWRQVGQIDEIHVELGREMKNSADKRKHLTQQVQENENTNLRIKAMLMEFKNSLPEIENVRPASPSQQDILRLYEEYALRNLSKDDADYDFISKVSKQAQVTSSEVTRYKAWLEQKYRSPYTGQTIPLSKLFTAEYEIEHVIPQSVYFDDSFSNKVICEAEVNRLKGNMLGHDFIAKHQGEIVELGFGRKVKIFSLEEYESFVKEHYDDHSPKRKKLLLDDIPDEFIARQLNDSRYISKLIKGLLSNIVREEGEQEAISKNVITCTGGITDRLKQEWGVNDVWNKIILPRFERMDKLSDSHAFTYVNASGHIVPVVPLEHQKGFNKKRIDHRHHAMDAIVIACATRDHVNLLNNEAAKSENKANRYQLSRKLRRYEKTEIVRKGKTEQIEVAREFLKPWDCFTQDVYAALNNIVVTFKQNLRVINKTINRYEHYNDNGKKVFVPQEKGENWAIRKSLHKDTVFGEVNLRKVKTVSLKEALEQVDSIVNKELKAKLKELLAQQWNLKQIKAYLEQNIDIWSDVDIKHISVYYFTKDTNDRYFATRKPLDTTFTKEKIEDKITDTGIQQILLAHLSAKGNNPELAFSPDGIDEMNRNIIQLNNGKFHQPILKVRIYEQANKFAVGQVGNKSKKFVENEKGTNLFVGIYQTADGKRKYATIPLNVVVERQKKGQSVAPSIDESGNKLLFVLSPNDLVYVPTIEDVNGDTRRSQINTDRIYKMVSASGTAIFFIKATTAKPIVDKLEFSTSNKMEKAITGEMIKEICVPLKVDRLGNIIAINGLVL
ncbi:MAG: type II CRISPR RNA-guided endonuclease Cas9 [Bacteroidales bacterium]|nr:type II CRISPR RNA-guided endonuclease Cas9 [Bacteroidales bacterium]